MPGPHAGPELWRFRRWAVTVLRTRSRPTWLRAFWCALLLYVLAFAVRSLHAADLAPLMDTAVQPGLLMTHRYDVQAVEILSGGGILFPRRPDSSATGLISRPPGYAMLLAALYSAMGRNLLQTQLVQNAICAVTPVLLLLLGARVLCFRVGLVAGTLVALAPHFAWNSNLILPDAPCVVPVLVGLLALAAGRRRRHATAFHVLAGLCLGASVWLRPNLLLLAPFIGVGLVASRPSAASFGRAGALVLTALAVVAPITIRNYLLFGAFVPVSTNLGVVMWEGIADAGGEKFGAVRTDREVARQEAKLYGDPRYRTWWAEPDGIRRDRDRVERSLAVIRAHPVWFAGAMLGRMAQMLDYANQSPPLVEARAPRTPPAPTERGRSGGWIQAEQLRRLGPRLGPAAALAPGAWFAALRPAVAVLQWLLCGTLTILVGIGFLLVALLCPRRALVLASVPTSFLLIQSALHLEFRVTLPMHAVLFVFAAAVPAAAAGALGARLRTRRP